MGPRLWRASANYRDYDGTTRRIERHRETGAKAERALVEYLKTRARVSSSREITADTRISEVCRIWFDELKQQKKATSTVNTYEDVLRLHVLPSVGSLRVREVTVGVADRFLATVRDKTGPSAAKHAKTVLSQVMALAARHDAIDHNPVRNVSPITVEKKAARALTLDEVRRLRAGLLADERAVARDIPAIVDFMLGTGLRIGEALAVTWEAVDLGAATVEVRGTLTYERGKGWVIQPRPKTEAGWRTLHLPPWLVTLLRARERDGNPWNVVFPSPLGKLRDRSNTNVDLREALDPLRFDWVTSHNFRKTAATLLNDGGLTVREIADQLGHKRVSVTQDTYFGRAQPSPEVAKLLGVIDHES
ncbi:tyrosine-type recombinase/integrase [Actinophytocola xanthii]|nr:site-specific integrase [Actinophytocola xanthii]